MTDVPEEELVIPQTGGIASQPSAEELAAVAQSHAAESKSPFALKYVFGFGLLILGLGVFIVAFLFSTRRKMPPIVEVPMVEETVDEVASESSHVQVQTFLDAVLSGNFLTQLETTHYPFDLEWQDRGIAFTLSAVYDLGVIEATSSVDVPEQYLKQRVVVAEVAAVDTRLTGPVLDLNADTYLAIRIGQEDFERADWLELTTMPGQTMKVFVPFTMAADTAEYYLLSGDLRNPFVSLIKIAPTDQVEE